MNNLQLVMLSIIGQSEEPMSGYDISKLISNKTGNSHQQVYRDLKKLYQKNLLILEKVEQSDKPDKKLYWLSELGQREFFSQKKNNVTDFSKSQAAYCCLTMDVMDGSFLYDQYVSHMKEAEKEFFLMHGEKYEHNTK